MACGLRDHLLGFQLMHRLLLWCALAVFGVGAWPHDLYAHPVTQCQLSTNPACDEGVAYQALQGMPSAHCGALSPGAYPRDLSIDHDQRGRRYTATFGCLNAKGGNIANDQSHFTVYGATCADRKQYNGAFPGSQYKPRSGSISCDLGCSTYWTHNIDGTVNGAPDGSICTPEKYDSDEDCQRNGAGYYYNRQIGVCEPPESKCENGKSANSLGKCEPEPCPEGMVQNPDGTCKKKDNECPAGNVRSPDGKCLPGDGQCAKGEVRGPDGTCKKDADDDGNPDEPGDKDTFSGGDDCSAPPSCSGSPIMCGQARIQWRIDCNTRKNRNIAGGACNTMPVCTGEKCDAMEYSGLLMQWRSACALEKMANSTGNGGENGDLKAIRDALTGTGGTVTLPPDRPASDAWAPGGGKVTNPDTSGYGWGGTCPQPPSIEVFGNSIQINTAPLCNWLFLGGYFVMGLAALASLRIVASKDA